MWTAKCGARRQSRKMSESSANSETSQKDLAMIQALKIELEQARDEREQMRRELRQSKDALPVQADAVQRLEMQVQDLSARLGGLPGQGALPGPPTCTYARSRASPRPPPPTQPASPSTAPPHAPFGASESHRGSATRPPLRDQPQKRVPRRAVRPLVPLGGPPQSTP